jgi:hypothetical protein
MKFEFIEQIEGTFPLDIPFVPFGYEYSNQFNNANNKMTGTLLTVLISMDPNVAIPRPLPVISCGPRSLQYQ